jgi:hypothetical protein
MKCLGLHNKPTAEVHLGHMLTGLKEEEEEEEEERICVCAPPVCLHGMDRDNLTFIFQYQIMK